MYLLFQALNRSGGFVKKGIDHALTGKNFLLSAIVIATIILGYFFPLAGFVVPVVMGIGMVVGAIRGRYTCGNLCPRGALFDSFLPFASTNRKAPALFRSSWFRWSFLTVMMSFMVFRILQNPTSVMHLGSVFWTICAITTPIGIIGGLIYHPRFWCSFCPMGTLQNALGGHRNRLRIDSSACKGCKICERACPLRLDIVKHRDAGVSLEKDCLKCRRCVLVCPKNALRVPSLRRRAARLIGKSSVAK